VEVSSKSDAELVSLAQQGDREAFGELYRRHYETVLRTTQWRLGGDAEEITQAAFARALERIGQCGGDQRFGPWVQTIACRLGVDHARREQRVATRMAASTEPAWSPARETPEDHALRRERAEVLSAVLAGLPRRQRQVLVARAVEERSPREIAAVLGLSVGAIDSLLLRARRAAASGYRAVAASEAAAGGGFPAPHPQNLPGRAREMSWFGR
jgi:RNA polymerase sigma-70 factor (ECF subfamily)